jgi:Ca-activated chloride channel family protein
VKYRYTKYTGDPFDEIDLEDLVSKLSDLLLSSGFSSPWGDPSGSEDRTLQALHDAILEALFSGGVLSEEALERLLGEPADGDQEATRQKLEELVQQIIERMMEQGFITGAPDLEEEREYRRGTGGGIGEDAGNVRFEVTDKALDFLGYRALRDLLGSIGRSSAGRHDTRHLSTGIEAISAPKPYEFGDTLNLDPSGTILNAVQRLHAEGSAVVIPDPRSPIPGT